MSNDPDVSVAMGVYNGGDGLRETMRSVLTQTRINLEFIIVNDGSTDESGRILAEFAESDDRVRVIEQENKGLTRSLITACAAARGKYIARQDVGDVSHPQRLFLQKQALDADEQLGFVSCWTEFCGPEWEFLFLIKGSGRAQSPISILSEKEKNGIIDGPTSHASVMFRKDFYEKAGGYRAEFYYGQDWDLWYRLAQCGTFQMIEQPLYRARILLDGISLDQKARQEAISALSRAALQQRQDGLSELEPLTRASLIRPQKQSVSRASTRAAGLYFVGECLRRNGDDRALDYFKRSIQSSPYLIRSWIRIFQQKLIGNRNKKITEPASE